MTDSLPSTDPEMTENYFNRPVIPLLVSLICGICLGSRFWGQDAWAYAVMAGATLWSLLIIRQEKTAVLSPMVVLVCLGYLLIQPWIVPRFPPDHVIHFAGKLPTQITGVIDSRPVSSGNRVNFILKVKPSGEKGVVSPAQGKIRVTVFGYGPELLPGDRVRFTGKVRSAKNFNNPGRFDYRRFLAFQDVWGTVNVSRKELHVAGEDHHKGSLTLSDFRNKISRLIDSSGTGDQIGLLKALILGDRTTISPAVREAFQRSGTSHLLAISGLHVGVIAAGAFIFFQWLFSRFTFFLWQARVRKTAAVLSLFPVFVYGILSGMSPSTQRAVIMVAVFLLTFLLEKKYDPVNALAVAAMLILVLHPPALFSISFQLSFLAVLFILYGLIKAEKFTALKNEGLQICKRVGVFFFISFFAAMGTLPLGMYYFNQVSVVGPLANLVIVPLIGFIVVPLGLLAVFLYPVSVWLATGMISLSGQILMHTLKIVALFSNLPFAAVKTITPSPAEIVGFYLLIWAVSNLQAFRRQFCPDRKGSLGGKAAAALIVVLLVAAGADAAYWYYHRLWHQDLRVTVVDVGQGSSALLEMPGGKVYLIDGGGFSDNSVFDVGARVLAPLLWRKKIRTVDTMILSHPDSDHLNGLLYIAEHFNVKSIWTNHEASDSRGYRSFKQIIDKKNIPYPQYRTAQRTHLINGVILKILYPPEDFLAPGARPRWDVNNNSMVIHVRFGAISFLFPGDVMTRAEKELVSTAGESLRSTVLVAPHHGHKKSSTAGFLQEIKPEVVVVSSGIRSADILLGSPVLKRYEQNGSKVFLTARQGAITMRTNGKSLEVVPYINSD
ncbi:MAG: DNA internalization-related competence protein ComEC/Rec2 [Desulfobacterales bacterium]|nr:DNA internalization-related competence protein ComEC/Rec2 [Desulfobacterales bacterium]